MTLLALKEDARASTAEKCVVDSLVAAGFRPVGGWFYPTGDSNRAAVKVCVNDGHFQLWRRRKLSSPWMLIVRSGVRDFDQSAFNSWRNAWPLTH